MNDANKQNDGTDDAAWRDHFVKPIADEMQKRGIAELHIRLKDGKAKFELLPEELEDCGTTHHVGCKCHERGWHNKWKVAVEMAAKAQVERDELRAIIDGIDEAMQIMNPRWCGDRVTMSGRYPCWILWLPKDGRCERKKLRTALLEYTETNDWKKGGAV